MLKTQTRIMVLLAGIICSASSQAQTVPPIHMTGANVEAVLDEIAKQAHLTIGLEASISSPSRSLESFDFEGGTVADLRSAFLSSHSQMLWTDFSPKSIVVSQRTPELEVIANTVIRLPEGGRKSRSDIWNAVITNPAYVAALRSVGCEPLNIQNGHEWKGDKGVLIAQLLESMPLEALLELAARSSGSLRWGIEERSQSGCRISIRL